MHARTKKDCYFINWNFTNEIEDVCVCVKQTVAVGSGFATVAAPRLAEGLAKGSSSFPRSSFGSDVFFAIVGSGAVNLKNRNPTLPKVQNSK